MSWKCWCMKFLCDTSSSLPELETPGHWDSKTREGYPGSRKPQLFGDCLKSVISAILQEKLFTKVFFPCISGPLDSWFLARQLKSTSTELLYWGCGFWKRYWPQYSGREPQNICPDFLLFFFPDAGDDSVFLYKPLGSSCHHDCPADWSTSLIGEHAEAGAASDTGHSGRPRPPAPSPQHHAVLHWKCLVSIALPLGFPLPSSFTLPGSAYFLGKRVRAFSNSAGTGWQWGNMVSAEGKARAAWIINFQGKGKG